MCLALLNSTATPVTRTLLKSTFVTGGMTLLSRISGLVRDVIFAGLIGAGTGIAADAFYVAFRIPNFLRRIFGEGAFATAFVPVFTEHKQRDSHQQLRAFTDRMTGTFGLVLLAVTAIGVLAAPGLVAIMAPGFDAAKSALTTDMLRLTFPYLFFISLVALSAGILNSYGRFGVAAFTPVLLNLCLIGSALWLAPRLDEPVMALAWGVLLAGMVQLLFQLPFLARMDMLPRPRIKRDHDGVAKVFRLMLPAIFGVSVSQINTLINTVIASFLATGSVSWLYYSDRLMEFPLGVFGIALATVILPSLSKSHAARSQDEFERLLDWGLRVTLLICIPATAGLIVLASPLVVSIYFRGAFTPNDVTMTTAALMAFAAGLPAFALVKVLAPGFYARQDTKTPVRIGVQAMLTNIVLSMVLAWPLRHVGLALAISLAACVNGALLYRRLRRDGVYTPLPGWTVFLARIAGATLVMTILLATFAGAPETWLTVSTGERVLRLGFWVMMGIAAYTATLFVFGVRPRELRLARPRAPSREPS